MYLSSQLGGKYKQENVNPVQPEYEWWDSEQKIPKA
jgi:hypothetical protein